MVVAITSVALTPLYSNAMEAIGMHDKDLDLLCRYMTACTAVPELVHMSELAKGNAFEKALFFGPFLSKS